MNLLTRGGFLLCFLLLAGSIFSQTTVTFNYTGSVQTYTVPPCVTQIDVIAAGAQGGGTWGGNGATVSGTLTVTPGQVLQIYVGGQGNCPGTGWNGGGNGPNASGFGNAACGGGGASDIRIAPFGFANRLIVAAGGGGMGGGDSDSAGGNGGCGSGNSGDTSFGSGATGGSQFSGGSGGGAWGSGSPGSSGSLGTGANGAVDPCYNTAPGGGGGGGYYGGGSGGSDCWSSATAIGGGGGGGGSSLTPAGGNCTAGNNTGNGYITITTNNSGMELEVTPSAAEICAGESVEITASGATNYTWSPAAGLNTTTGPTVTASPAATQTYLITADDGVDCSDTISVTVTVLPNPVISVSPSSAEICSNETVSLTASGATSYSWSPGLGLNTTSGATVSATLSASQTYTVTGTSGTCTGDTTVTVTVYDPETISFSPDDPVLCPGESVDITASGGQTYSWSPATGLSTTNGATVTANPASTTTYSVEWTDLNGCTYTDDITVSVIETDPETTTEVAICEGENHILPDGTTVDESGIYNTLLTSTAGCDSLVITELMVNPVYSLSQSAALCEGESFLLPDGNTVSVSGSYEVNLISSTGCDSTITFDVVFHPVYEESYTPTICDSQSYIMPDGSEETTAGEYTFSYTSEFGCDSIINVSLTVLETVIVPQEITLCDNETFTLPDGTTADEAGLYEVVIVSDAACDSLYQIQIDLLPTYNTTTNISICEGESYTLPDGSTEESAGSYPVLLSSVDGCDSLVNYNLSLLPVYSITQSVNICEGETYTLPDGSVADATGSYPVSFSTTQGCDSVITTNLTVRPEYDEYVVSYVCADDNPLDPYGNPLTSDAAFELDFTSVFGCDSTVYLQVYYHEPYADTTSVIMCEGEEYITSGGQVISFSGLYTDAFTNSGGCDSLKHYDVTVNPAPIAAFTPSEWYTGIYDGPVQFFNTSSYTDSLVWDFGIYGKRFENNPVIDFSDDPGFFPVCIYTWNNYGCADSYCLDYEVREVFTVYIPSAFTPNGDGKNDLFYVQGRDIDPERFRLQIFNRLGEVVFETTDPEEKWDGSSQRQHHYAEDEIYVFRVEVHALSVKESREITGKVVVLR